MAPIPPAAFANALGDLGGEEFAALVAQLWAGCGWDVERDGQLVRVARRGESRTLLVLPPRRLARFRRAPATDEPVDAVVTPRLAPSRAALPRGLPVDAVDADDANPIDAEDATVIDAADLRERALYGIETDDAVADVERVLGVPLSGQRWSRADGAARSDAVRRLPAALRRSPGPLVAAVAVLVVLGALAAAGGPAAVLQGSGDLESPGPNGSAASAGADDGGDAAADDGSSGGSAGDSDGGADGPDGGADETDGGADETDGDGPDSGGVSPLPTGLRSLTSPGNVPDDGGGSNATWSDLYESSPNCERGPLAVARLLSAGFTGPYPDRSLELYWEFANPDVRASTDYGPFAGTHRAAYQRVFRADRIDLAEPRRVADDPPQVVIAATVRWGEDFEHYEFELRRRAPADEEPCWVVDRFSSPAD